VDAFVENIWQVVAMAVLLFFSAFMSGSETAFSNISSRQLQLFLTSANKLQNLAAKLLKNPRHLLTSLLFGNMVVNILFFALAGVLSVNLDRQIGPVSAISAAIIAFLVLLLTGEMLPKSLAYTNSRRFCIVAAPVCFVCMQILSPLLRVFDAVIISPALRLLVAPTGSAESPGIVTANQFKLLIDSWAQQGLISSDENQLLAEVVELGLLKARHVMTPRVDMIACETADSPRKAQQLMTQNKLTKIPVYVKTVDNIAGTLLCRDILLNPDKPIRALLRKVNFVPEQKSAESLLDFFRRSKTDTAIVVDEYGGIAGSVSLTNIVEEILGPMEPEGRIVPVERISPLRYRLAGNLAIHDWTDVFGIDPAQSRLTTVGGLTTALLGRIPKSGDIAYLKNLKLFVEKVRKHRIETLILSLEPLDNKK